MQQLSGQDALFLHSEFDDAPTHTGGVSIYDQSTSPNGVVRFKEILAMFASRLDRSPIFRRKLAMVPLNLDQPYWVDDDSFDLEFHVRHIALPSPGDWRQLCIQVARLHARPLDRQRPLWEAYIIEGLDQVRDLPKGCFALYLKVHHCAMDGASGVQFFSAFNDLSPNPPKDTPLSTWRPESQPGTSTLLAKAYINNLLKPWRLARLAREFIPSHRRVKEGIKLGKFHKMDFKPPPTRFNAQLSPHRVIDAVKFHFEDIRAIRGAVVGATINDVMLAIVSGGLRNYLLDKRELPAQSLVSLCPVNIRDASDKNSDGNIIGTIYVPLCTDIDDPVKRLRKIHQESDSAKAYNKARGHRVFMSVMDSVPTAVQTALISVLAAQHYTEKHVMQNTAVTNVPSSPNQLYMCGAQIIDSFGIGALSPGMGLFHTVNSAVMKNKGMITLAFLACRDAMPDPDFYTGCLHQSFKDLQQACLTNNNTMINNSSVSTS